MKWARPNKSRLYDICDRHRPRSACSVVRTVLKHKLVWIYDFFFFFSFLIQKGVFYTQSLLACLSNGGHISITCLHRKCIPFLKGTTVTEGNVLLSKFLQIRSGRSDLTLTWSTCFKRINMFSGIALEPFGKGVNPKRKAFALKQMLSF